MAKADKVENKDQKVEKSSKKSNKSSYSKKKKIKKNILNGIAYLLKKVIKVHTLKRKKLKKIF